MTFTTGRGSARALTATLALLLLLSTPALAAGRNKGHQAGAFDFYVLALSWSPTFCLTAGEAARREQCARGSRRAFVVHGLWPQFERGYPDYCATREPERVPTALARPLLDIAPSLGLIGHMWRKHGSCSGLSQRDYLAAVREAYERITIPDALDGVDDPEHLSAEAVEAAFIEANPGLTRDAIATRCVGRRLQEVRICLTHDFGFRSCREIDAEGCRAARLAVPAPG
jgi:Ribonuclease I